MLSAKLGYPVKDPRIILLKYFGSSVFFKGYCLNDAGLLEAVK
jgi:hypothetical protein